MTFKRSCNSRDKQLQKQKLNQMITDMAMAMSMEATVMEVDTATDMDMILQR